MKVILFGASNFSKSVDFYLSRESNYKVVAYTDNKKALEGNSEFNGKPLCSFDLVEKIYPPTEFKMFVAVGYVKLNAIRKYFIEKAIEKGYELINHISPTSIYWDDLILGQNIFIFEGNIVQPEVQIGTGVILSRGNSIGHGSIIGDYAFLANRTVLCGNCYIGSGSFVGSNATICDDVIIAERNLIGANCLIRKNTKPAAVYVQEAAKELDKDSSAFFNW